MKQEDTSIEALREQLTEALAEWGTRMSAALQELDQRRRTCAEAEAKAADWDEERACLKEQSASQARTIESLKKSLKDAGDLREQSDEKDSELERLQSELDSKQEIIHALRRDAGTIDRLKAEQQAKDRTIERLQVEQREMQERLQTLDAENRAFRESEESQSQGESAELEAVRAELEARKTVIKSLRADAERVDLLEARLEEKRDIIATLEESINRHADTIAELKRSADQWKRKYQSFRNISTIATSAELPVATATDIEAVAASVNSSDDLPSDRTIAIDMREPLLEARRSSSAGRKKT